VLYRYLKREDLQAIYAMLSCPGSQYVDLLGQGHDGIEFLYVIPMRDLRFIEEDRASCSGNASKRVGDHALMASL